MRGRLLFLTYTFPPARTAGAVRTWNVAKYLARSGWAVSVVTPDPSLWRHVENSEATEVNLEREGIRRLATGHRWRCLVPSIVKGSNGGLAWALGGVCRRASRALGIDRTAGWAKAAEIACTGLTANDVDVILASGPSFSAFPLARRLAERLRRPYVLDYRDLWSRNLHHPTRLAVGREAWALARSAAVTTVSSSWRMVLERHFGVGAKLHVISNGYDAEELAQVAPREFGHFAIVYTGALWPPKRVISPVMAALRLMKGATDTRSLQWMFHYYGRNGRHVLEEAERFGVTDRVVVHGQVPRSEALSAVKGAGAAVVITSVGKATTAEDNGMVTGKIFEAVGLGTPTLLIAPADSDANAVVETSGLARSFVAQDIAGIATFLTGLMAGNTLTPKCPAAYAWQNLVGEFDDVLRKVTGP